VGGAVEAAALAAGAAAHVDAVLLGLVPTVLAVDGARAEAAASPPAARRRGPSGRRVIGEADDVGRVERVLLDHRGVVRPQLEPARGRGVEVGGRRRGRGRGVGAGGRVDGRVVAPAMLASSAA
jgi:hypothetical protein